MKCLTVIVRVTVVIIAISGTGFSAPLDQNKLSLLDQEGYEVISGAEEFLTPVTSEKDNNRIDLPQGMVESEQKPDILLYGKFVVLRRKGLLPLSDKENIGAYSEYAFRNMVPKEETKPSGTANKKTPKFTRPESTARNDVIVFPSDATPSKKKYIRHRPTSDEGASPPLPYSHTPSQRTQTARSISTTVPTELKASSSETREEIPAISTPAASSKVQLSPTLAELVSKSVKSSDAPEDATIDEIEGMSSDEFVDWTKWNLQTDQISQLLEDASNEDETTTVSSTDIEEEGTTVSDIGYNSFIQVPDRVNPSTGCPEGQKKNHKGICTQIYKHNTRLRTRVGRGNTRAKLASLLESLKALDHMSIDALVETEREVLKDAIRIHREIRDRTLSMTADFNKRLSTAPLRPEAEGSSLTFS